MIRLFLYISLSFGALFLFIYGIQVTIFDSSSQVRFDFKSTNTFFGLSSYLICVHFIFFSTLQKLKPQLGFIYLPTLFIKGILFYAIFKDSVFSIEILTISERLHLLIPLLVFLILEVYCIAKIINRK